jgi:tetratricopeptide (TPR) repeat protein
MNELGAFYRGMSRYGESVEAFKNAMDSYYGLYDTKDDGYATIINNLAGTYRLMGKPDEALSLFSEALRIYESLDSYDKFGYAGLLNNMAIAYDQAGDTGKATEYTKRAIDILGSLDEIAYATSYTNLASLYLKLDDMAGAENSLGEALNVFDKEENRLNPHHAAALNMAAAISVQREEYGQAIGKFNEALNITEMYFGKNVEYAIACSNIADVYVLTGKNGLALEYLRNTQDIFKRVYGEESSQYIKITGKINKLSEECG